MCKNVSDGVCLLGQSYVDVFQSVQTIDDEAKREQIARQLACCSFWEESDLAKQISREVTLSQHAWNRIAYIKLQKADQEMFAGLIGVARSVLHSHDHEPMAELQPAPIETTTPASSPVLPSDAQPELPAADSAAATEPSSQAETIDLKKEDDLTPPLSRVVNLPVVAPPSSTVDPVEQAMQELWAITAEATTSTPPGAEVVSAQWGRGSGRATDTPEGDPTSSHWIIPTIA
jgi:hypothetical protein